MTEPDRGGADRRLRSTDDRAVRLIARLATEARSSRFTYLPHTGVAYTLCGPVITYHADGLRPGRSPWSDETLESADAEIAPLVALVARDVHRAVVRAEADRICLAFHVDGHRAWYLVPDRSGADAAAAPEPQCGDPIAIAVTHHRPAPSRGIIPSQSPFSEWRTRCRSADLALFRST